MKFKEHDLFPVYGEAAHHELTAEEAEILTGQRDQYKDLSLYIYSEDDRIDPDDEDFMIKGVLYPKNSSQHEFCKNYDIPYQRVWLTEEQVDELE